MRYYCQCTTSCFKEEMGVSFRINFELGRSPYYTVTIATIVRYQTLEAQKKEQRGRCWSINFIFRFFFYRSFVTGGHLGFRLSFR